ncbi:MAG: SulP family inorganic anion transporter [Sulfuriferula multivorans]|uniref:SulP family inorganic anion transporter n=1 Tax=Sulfuriferula multivorans TaxID=1559896 RepID=A0A7C9K9L3_9PROT|nr:SulP family inorganic anion transporter [Sulfuriferula multivorans]
MRYFSKQRFGKDLSSGLTTTLVTIPDALASAVLAGLNPVYGLYAVMIGTPVAALAMSSQLMYVANTGALAVATGSALSGYSGDALLQALVVVTFLVGLIQLGLGLLRLGAITRFVSNAVMIGFMTAIMARIILGQLGELTGFKSDADNPVLQALDLAGNLAHVHGPTFAAGLFAVALIVLVERTRLRHFSMILAVLATSLAVYGLGLDSVRIVADLADIPDSLPLPALPQFGLVMELLPSAAAIALIGLVQSAGVSRSIPNPDGNFPNVSRDFAGQGIANLVASLFKGMPTGGTMSETAVHVGAGATSRWAAVYSGLMILAFVLLLGSMVEQIAKPAIAALLIVAAVQVIKVGEILDVWRTSLTARTVMVATFVATLALSVEQSVLLGVVLSAVLYLYHASMDVHVMEMVATPDGDFEEHPTPRELPGGKVTVINLYGSLFFAAADLLAEQLPSSRNAQRAVVILRLRGRSNLGSTIYNVLERYAAQLSKHGGKLILSGVSDVLYPQLVRTDLFKFVGEEYLVRAERRPAAAMRTAMALGEAWLENRSGRE